MPVTEPSLTTRAAFIDHLGPPEAIRYAELSIAGPGPTDALVEVAATTVNRVDTLIRSGAYRTQVPCPFVVGRDLTGTVRWAPPGLGFAVGDRVWCNSLGYAGRQGAAAAHAVVPVERLYHLPDEVSPGDAVAVVHPAATAYLALFTHGQLRMGDTALVGGAAGNVGSAMTLLAGAAGARVIALAAADDA